MAVALFAAPLEHPPEWSGAVFRLGHALTGVPRRPVREDPFQAGARGHGLIEVDALTPLIGLARARQVYFGNWQRDQSQLITPLSVAALGDRAPVLNKLLFELMDALAEATFGSRLERVRFGTYRWEEHGDNPRSYGVAVDPLTSRYVADQSSIEARPESTETDVRAWTDAGDGIPSHLHASRRYILRELAAALASGPGAAGYEHVGNALHTVEDFYAHSNFVELAVLLHTGTGDPGTGVTVEGTPVRDARGRLRLTTGVFLPWDTAVSLSKLLVAVLEGHPPMPGDPDVRAVLKRIAVRRLLGTDALRVYDEALRAWNASGIPMALQAFLAATGLTRLREAVEKEVEQPLKQAVAGLLRPITEAAARRPVRLVTRALIGGRLIRLVEASHSQIAKDDTHRASHPLARGLAVQAVRDVWHELDGAWRAGLRDPRWTQLPALVATLTSHPADVPQRWRPAVTAALGPARGSVIDTGPPPPSPPPSPNGAAVLRRGSRGPRVLRLQRLLNQRLRRLRRPELVVDGYFGPRTEARVRGFQAARGLPADGVVGSRTWAALDPAGIPP